MGEREESERSCAAGKFMRNKNEPLAFSTLLRAILADEPYGQRIAEKNLNDSILWRVKKQGMARKL
jgi:hypothetical protein